MLKSLVDFTVFKVVLFPSLPFLAVIFLVNKTFEFLAPIHQLVSGEKGCAHIGYVPSQPQFSMISLILMLWSLPGRLYLESCLNFKRLGSS